MWNLRLLLSCAFIFIASCVYGQTTQNNVYSPQTQGSNVYYPQDASNVYGDQGVLPSQTTVTPRKITEKQRVEQKWKAYQDYYLPNSVNSAYYPAYNPNYRQPSAVYQSQSANPTNGAVVYPSAGNTPYPVRYPSQNVYNQDTTIYPNQGGTAYPNQGGTIVYPNQGGVVYPNQNPSVVYPNQNPNVVYPNGNVAPNQGVYLQPSYGPPPGEYGTGPNQRQSAILRSFDQQRSKILNSDRGSYYPTGTMGQRDMLKYRAIQQQEELMKRELKQQEGLNR